MLSLLSKFFTSTPTHPEDGNEEQSNDQNSSDTEKPTPTSRKTMATLTADQATIIKATVPVLAAHGLAITTQFYANVLAAHPALKNVFNNTHQASGHQAQALAGALYAYAANIGVLSPAVELICHKHASLYITPEQYEVVGHHLLLTMKTVLGDAATPAILDAWGAAYWQLANIMIQKEGQMYKDTSYWKGWQDFKIARKEEESSEITSFYLEPVDAELKKNLPMYKPGQYVSINVFLEELDGGLWQARQYSLSDAPGKSYLRISVKKEPGVEIGEPKHMTHPGYISNLLRDTKSVGDVVRVSHPFGDFFFEEKGEKDDAPVVLISAGVGLTALTSVFNTLVEKKSSRQISWIHGARNASKRAFKSNVDRIAIENENVHTFFFASGPQEGEMQGKDYNIQGRVNLNQIPKKLLFTENDKTQYFVCGPSQFMVETEKKLKSFGVPSERVKMELFGTGGVARV